MNISKTLHIYFFYVFFIIIHKSYAFKCYLPEGCHLQSVSASELNDSNENGDMETLSAMCDINGQEFEFKFKEPTPFVAGDKCSENETIADIEHVILRWTQSNEETILDNRVNFSNMAKYSEYFIYPLGVKLWGLKGFDLYILDDIFVSNHYSFYFVELSNCRLAFYHHKKRKIDSCEDIVKSNKTQIVNSIFQMNVELFSLKNVEYKGKISPLIFLNSRIGYFYIHGLIDSFYKKNILKFSNETFPDFPELNSTILTLKLMNVHNINLDLNLLNRLVFNKTNNIEILGGSLNSISGEIFKHLSNLLEIEFDPMIFRKIVHKQGMEWIRQWNYGLNNVTDSSIRFKYIAIYTTIIKQRIAMSKVFPDEDFCVYRDFPFNQYVIIYEYVEDGNISIRTDITKDYTCTYLWLVQYYGEHLKNLQKIEYFFYFKILEVIHTNAFKSISECNFEKRLNLCNQSNYRIKEIWDESDFFLLNKKLQIAFKISLYPISLLGLITNFIVVLVILKKENSDLFKQFKQYNYLYLNSIFCMMISVIELFSWMTECFYPFEAFCPEIRKLVVIQFFKIIFTECFVTMSRFMCNFTYVAFALNRISLIGREHGKLVTFMSELGVKKYMVVTFFISSSLSWIKGFKYQVNYFYPESNFPISNEMNIILSSKRSSRFKDFYLTFISISDLVNYTVFVVICSIIDICMVVQLRRTLEEKTKKSESMNQKQNESKKTENEEVVNKAIKMVVLNSAIGIFFKLPVCFVPLLNSFAEFYYKNVLFKFNHPRFGDFYSMLVNSQSYYLIQDMSHLFFNLSLSIQMFIYNRFDKKFRTGFEKLKDQVFLRKSSKKQ